MSIQYSKWLKQYLEGFGIFFSFVCLFIDILSVMVYIFLK